MVASAKINGDSRSYIAMAARHLFNILYAMRVMCLGSSLALNNDISLVLYKGRPPPRDYYQSKEREKQIY